MKTSGESLNYPLNQVSSTNDENDPEDKSILPFMMKRPLQ
jgi:hypothetical protein